MRKKLGIGRWIAWLTGLSIFLYILQSIFLVMLWAAVLMSGKKIR